MDSEPGTEIPSSLRVNENPLCGDSDTGPLLSLLDPRGLVEVLFVGQTPIAVLTLNTVAVEREVSPADSRVHKAKAALCTWQQ